MTRIVVLAAAAVAGLIALGPAVLAAPVSYTLPDETAAFKPGANVEPVGPANLMFAMPRYLNNRAASIYGGSNEIQRDIMARLRDPDLARHAGCAGCCYG